MVKPYDDNVGCGGVLSGPHRPISKAARGSCPQFRAGKMRASPESWDCRALRADLLPSLLLCGVGDEDGPLKSRQSAVC